MKASRPIIQVARETCLGVPAKPLAAGGLDESKAMHDFITVISAPCCPCAPVRWWCCHHRSIHTHRYADARGETRRPVVVSSRSAPNHHHRLVSHSLLPRGEAAALPPLARSLARSLARDLKTSSPSDDGSRLVNGGCAHPPVADHSFMSPIHPRGAIVVIVRGVCVWGPPGMMVTVT